MLSKFIVVFSFIAMLSCKICSAALIYSDLGGASPTYSYSGNAGAGDTLIPATLVGTGDSMNPAWRLTSIQAGVYLTTNNLTFTEQIVFKIYGNMNTAATGVVNTNLLGTISANVSLSGIGAKFITLTVPPGIDIPAAVNPATIGIQQEEFFGGSTTPDGTIRSLFVNAGPTVGSTQAIYYRPNGRLAQDAFTASDQVAFTSSYQQYVSLSATAVPEPAGTSVLAIGACLLLKSNRVQRRSDLSVYGCMGACAQ